MVTPEEQALIADRMAEAGISNMGAYMRKMALNGYVLHVDLSDIRELVALQRRCANNLNQVAVHANTYGIYPSEITALQKDYQVFMVIPSPLRISQQICSSGFAFRSLRIRKISVSSGVISRNVNLNDILLSPLQYPRHDAGHNQHDSQ